MRQTFILLASLILATTLAGCGTNGADPFTPAQSADLNTAVNNAISNTATAASNAATAAAAAVGLTPANTVAAAQQTITLAQVATANHLTPAQTVQIQTILQQGTANDQQAGLSPAQQADNTRRRLLVLAVLFGQNQ